MDPKTTEILLKMMEASWNLSPSLKNIPFRNDFEKSPEYFKKYRFETEEKILNLITTAFESNKNLSIDDGSILLEKMASQKWNHGKEDFKELFNKDPGCKQFYLNCMTAEFNVAIKELNLQTQ